MQCCVLSYVASHRCVAVCASVSNFNANASHHRRVVRILASARIECENGGRSKTQALGFDGVERELSLRTSRGETSTDLHDFRWGVCCRRKRWCMQYPSLRLGWRIVREIIRDRLRKSSGSRAHERLAAEELCDAPRGRAQHTHAEEIRAPMGCIAQALFVGPHYEARSPMWRFV